MAETDRPIIISDAQPTPNRDDLLEPQDSQVTKSSRFSLESKVSGDLQILQVTYSTIILALIHNHVPHLYQF